MKWCLTTRRKFGSKGHKISPLKEKLRDKGESHEDCKLQRSRYPSRFDFAAWSKPKARSTPSSNNGRALDKGFVQPGCDWTKRPVLHPLPRNDQWARRENV